MRYNDRNLRNIEINNEELEIIKGRLAQLEHIVYKMELMYRKNKKNNIVVSVLKIDRDSTLVQKADKENNRSGRTKVRK